MKILEIKHNLIQDKIKPLFKNNGFTVSGNHWRKKEEGFIKVFNIQSSQFNTSNQIRLYINIGVFFPDAYPLEFTNAFYGGKIPELGKFIKKPSVENCQFNKRAFEIFKGIEDYHLNEIENRFNFENVLLNDIEKQYLPFFDNLNSVENCNTFFQNFYGKSSLQYEVAIALASIGKYEQAKRILHENIEKNRPSYFFIETLSFILEKLNCDLKVPVIEVEKKNINSSKGSYP